MTETTIAGPGLLLSNGDHVCVFCRGGERDELLVPFLTDGVSAGDRCLAVVDTSEPEELLDALGTAGAPPTGPTSSPCSPPATCT
jgi:MEDS: MEthanogen/methylotroph, DcmR Sensory domain